MATQKDLLQSVCVEWQRLLGETGVCTTTLSEATPALIQGNGTEDLACAFNR